MLGLSSCLGRQQQKDNLIEDQSTKIYKLDQQVDQVNNKPLDQCFEATPQIQASTPSERCESENPDDQVKPRLEVIDDIVNHLKKEDVYRVILQGKHGVGKTWIAKEVAKQNILNHIIDFTIWIYPNGLDVISVDLKSLHHQLSLHKEFDGAEYLLHDELKKLSVSMKEKLKGRRYLVVLDGGHSEKLAEKVVKFLEEMLDSGSKNLSKILITRVEAIDCVDSDNIDDSKRRTVVVEIKPLTLSESTDLLQRSWTDNHIGVVEDDDVEEIVKRCTYFPAAIVFTGNVLGYVLKNECNELNKELAIREAKKLDNDYLELGFDKFVNNITILRCFLLSRMYLERRGSMRYDELILCWMLGGYFEEKTSLEQAYAHAHNVLMDLLDAGILGEREAGYVVLERTGVNFGYYFFPFLHEHIIHLEVLYNQSFRRNDGVNVKRLNGTIAAFTKMKYEGVSIVILLVKGNRLSVEDPNKFCFEYDPTNDCHFPLAKSLRILYISHVRLNLCVELMNGLEFLILRNCQLTNLQDLKIGKSLSYLDISGCTISDKIPDDFLVNHSLECLNLSDSSIKSLPSTATVMGLRLRYLFLSRTLLQSFPDVSGLKELEVLDLSGAKFESLNMKVCNLELPKLRILDLSESYIYEFPCVGKLQSLSYLLLKNCPLLNKFRPVTRLTSLRVIVASGCTGLHFFREMNLPRGNCLRKLDLSETKIHKLPPLKNASNLVYLYLRGCQHLKELPIIEGAKNLRLLDVSDAIQLELINTCFQDMKSLRELLLSNTKIKSLPPLSGLESLRKLILRGCESLLTIPESTGLLTNLLLLDVRGCIALETLVDEQFSHVTVLKS